MVNESDVFINQIRIEAGQQMNVTFENLSCKYYVKEAGKQRTVEVLKNVNGFFKSGHLTAIVGPSGTGKTTLLNILSGLQEQGVTGRILINDKVRDRNRFKKSMAYVQQCFTMLPKLTVRETLMTAIDLKLGIKYRFKEKLANNILAILKLIGTENIRVENLSGGEHKRLSIGIELITNPPVILFDEPTTGLDSVSSYQIMTHIKYLANDLGRTVICAIHQPASKLVQLFDDVYVLSGGHCLYGGTMDDMTDRFANAGFVCPNYYNRIDYALEIASMEKDEKIDELIRRSKKVIYSDVEMQKTGDVDKLEDFDFTVKKIENDVPRTGNDSPNRFDQQVFILIKRQIISTCRDMMFAQLRVICHILVGILLGIVFYDIGHDSGKVISNSSCIFFFILFIFFSNAMPTVVTVPMETGVILREHLNNWYPVRSYYVSRTLADLPLQIICPTLFILIAYYMTGQPMETDRFLRIWFIATLTAILAQTIGLVAGTLFTLPMGIFLVSATSIPMLIFSGFFIRYNELSTVLQPITYLSYFRYLYEGSLQSIYGYGRGRLHCTDTFCYFRSADKFMEFMSITPDRFWNSVLGIVIWIIVLQISLYISLKIVIKKRI